MHFARSTPRFGILGLALAGAVGCTQPPVPCTTAHGSFAAKFRGPADAPLLGDVIGLNAYNAPVEGTKVPDFEKVSMAIGTEFLGAREDANIAAGLPDEDPDHQRVSVGAFEDPLPGENGACRVSALTPAEKNLPAVPASDGGTPDDPEDDTPALPAAHLVLEWSDVEVYVRPNALGTQMAGTLTVTEAPDTDEETSTAYEVLAVFPVVSCVLVDDPASPDAAPVLDENGNLQADARWCDPVAHPEDGFPVGSGLGPELKTVCDPDLFLCVLDSDEIQRI